MNGLIRRMRGGEREAAAEFVTRYGPMLRRRVRGKLRTSMRRIFDSQDILSTVGRRLDQYVAQGRFEAREVDELWALVVRIANNAIVDKARVFRRLEGVEDSDGVFAQAFLKRLRDEEARQGDADIEIDRALRSIDDLESRQILALWLNDEPFDSIAELLGLTPACVRKRWQRIRESLREKVERGDL